MQITLRMASGSLTPTLCTASRVRKASRRVSASFSGATAPESILCSSTRAWARKPTRGSASNAFCQLAVSVAATSQAVGSSVTQT